ncbi:hypothetical protein, partial [Pantoea ananatis]|uniref:hypothetical protein n=1 Tax=Pantoea ananas TaxID=553 RepID=UPI001B3070C2
SFVIHCGLTDRPDAPSLAQPSSSRLPCRAVLAFALSSARRMPPENTRLWGRVFLFGAVLPGGFFFMSLPSRLRNP